MWGTYGQVIACLESSLFAILNSQREIGDEFVSIRIFWYWDFENRSLRVDGKIDWSRDNNCDRVDKWWRWGDSGLQRLEMVLWTREQWVVEDSACLQWRMTGKHSPFELKDALSAFEYQPLSATLQEMADTPHLLFAMLNVVETRHRSLSGCWAGIGSWVSPSSIWMSWQTPFVHLHVVDVTRNIIGIVNRTIKISNDEIVPQ